MRRFVENDCRQEKARHEAMRRLGKIWYTGGPATGRSMLLQRQDG